MKTTNLELLTDELLELEILWAHRSVSKATADLRNSSLQTSEDGIIHLTREEHNIRAYLSHLVNERAKRQQGGNYDPRRSGMAKEIVCKKAPANNTRQ